MYLTNNPCHSSSSNSAASCTDNLLRWQSEVHSLSVVLYSLRLLIVLHPLSLVLHPLRLKPIASAACRTHTRDCTPHAHSRMPHAHSRLPHAPLPAPYTPLGPRAGGCDPAEDTGGLPLPRPLGRDPHGR